jgi:hypothetical protein
MEKQPQEEMGTPGQMETPEQERMRTPESSEDMKSY